jgi:hypothetical protein
MTQNVVSLTGDPVPGADLEPNAGAIALLEDLLERARAGEVIGVGAVTLHSDRLTSWHLSGRCGGYGMVGAASMLHLAVAAVADGLD